MLQTPAMPYRVSGETLGHPSWVLWVLMMPLGSVVVRGFHHGVTEGTEGARREHGVADGAGVALLLVAGVGRRWAVSLQLGVAWVSVSAWLCLLLRWGAVSRTLQ